MSEAPRITLPPGGATIGIGCDLIEVERIQQIIERHGDRFLTKTFTDEERAYCTTLKFPHKHYAARWAAKEAVAKAFSTGFGEHLDWTSISVYHGERQEPLIRLDEKGSAFLREVGGTSVLISLSHTETHAMAFATLVRS